MPLWDIVHTAESAMRRNIEAIDYELNGWDVLRYGVKLNVCK